MTRDQANKRARTGPCAVCLAHEGELCQTVIVGEQRITKEHSEEMPWAHTARLAAIPVVPEPWEVVRSKNPLCGRHIVAIPQVFLGHTIRVHVEVVEDGT